MPARRSRRAPAILLSLAVIGAVKAAAWLYFRNRQPLTDAQTLNRLQPRRR